MNIFIDHILRADNGTVKDSVPSVFVDLLTAVASHPWGLFCPVAYKHLLLLGINICLELGL